MTLTVRLKPDLESQIEILANRQGLTKSQWVRRLIEQAVAVETAKRSQTPFELMEELGLIGCIENGPPDLATNAKQYLRDKLDAPRSR